MNSEHKSYSPLFKLSPDLRFFEKPIDSWYLCIFFHIHLQMLVSRIESILFPLINKYVAGFCDTDIPRNLYPFHVEEVRMGKLGGGG